MSTVRACARYRLLLALLLAVIGFGTLAREQPSALAQVQARIAKPAVLRGAFEQEKRLQGFTHALESRGRFLIARDRGVVWTVVEPFPSELVLTADRILSRQADGSTRVELDVRGQPALAAVNAMLLALVRGDVQALAARFEIRVEALADSGWRLSLTPGAGVAGQAFREVVLEGDRHVRKVVMEGADGDRTTLLFMEMSETPAQLSADEAARFD